MTNKDKFKQFKRWIRFYLIRLVVFAITRYPASKLPKIKQLLKKAFHLFFQKEKKKAMELIPAEFSSKKDKIIDKMMDNQILTLLEVFFYEKLISSNPDYIKIEGLDIIKEAYQKHGSFIILSAHFGNWEIMGYTLAKLGYKMNVIAREQADNQMTKFMNSFRENRDVEVIMKNNIIESIKRVKKGEIVGLLSDLNAREWGYQTTFFGKKASFYNAPVILSMRGKAPLIPSFVERQKDGTQLIRFEKPIEWKKGTKMSEKIRQYVERYESAFRRRPDLWCWFHPRYDHAELGRTD
jgi:KDO2-lipid IV(A) lauroyltransferase